jgi:hypothetical protein
MAMAPVILPSIVARSHSTVRPLLGEALRSLRYASTRVRNQVRREQIALEHRHLPLLDLGSRIERRLSQVPLFWCAEHPTRSLHMMIIDAPQEVHFRNPDRSVLPA